VNAYADAGAHVTLDFTDAGMASTYREPLPRVVAGLDTLLAEASPALDSVADIGDVAGASLQADGYTGRARAVVDEDRQVLLGVTFVGSDVAEMLQSATIAVVGEVPLSRLWHAVPAYPTMSEVWLRLLEVYGRPSA